MPARAESPRFILGLKAKKARQQRGEPLRTVARRAGLSVSYLSEIEKGKKYPKPDKLVSLARALEIPFDELVSLKVDRELGPLKDAFGSTLLREFPLELFGIEPEDLFAIFTDHPGEASALVQAFAEVGRTYDVHVEHFLLAALRSYQQLHGNHFPELEEEAAAFRRELGLEPGEPLSVEALEGVLTSRWAYALDRARLTRHPVLSTFRSVFAASEPPRLFLNPRLRPEQQAFALAREVGYRRLGLSVRAITSSWIAVESFEQVLNNLRASYFAGAILIDRPSLVRDLDHCFSLDRWEGAALLDCLERYRVTPETFFHRMTEVVPSAFGLDEIYFLRFNDAVEPGSYRLTKFLNMSRVPLPHGAGPHEHYCRRWPAMRLLPQLAALRSSGQTSRTLITPQRSDFLDAEASFFEMTMARPLSLQPEGNSSVTVGLLVDDAFRERVRFHADPAIPRRTVNLTCERCPLPAPDCTDRAADPLLLHQLQAQRRKQAAVTELLEEVGSG